MAELYGKKEGCSRRLRRLDAPLRPRAREPRRERRRRRRPPRDHRCRACLPVPRASRASRSPSSATAPRTRARSTSRSTSPSCGRCRRSSCSRTTAGRSRRRPRSTRRSEDFSQRAVAFGMHSIEVDGQDVEEVYAATREAREYARLRPGPRLPERAHLSARRPLHRRPAGLPRRRRSSRSFARRRTRSSSCARSSSSPTRSSRRSTPRPSAIVEASVEFAKAGTDPKPEDALKYVYA